MYEYYIHNKVTGEYDFIWGYSLNNALKRAKLNEQDITVLYTEYID